VCVWRSTHIIDRRHSTTQFWGHYEFIQNKLIVLYCKRALN